MDKKKKDLNTIQFFYITEIIRGLYITSVHFFKNFALHILHLFGIAKNKKAMVTYQYPEEKREITRRARTRHRIMKREDGTPRCVACMMCETVCPGRCIYIVAKEVENPEVEKAPEIFEIDLGRCIYCGYCVEACPEDAIRMDTFILDTASYDRDSMLLTLEDLLNHDNQDDLYNINYMKK